MPPPEWGARYICFACGCKFYDLNRPKPLCPRCGSDQRDAKPHRHSKSSTAQVEEEVERELIVEPDEVVPIRDVLLDEEEEEEEEVEVEGEF